MKIPIKIEKCRIVEAILEIRFKTDVPSDAIFGKVYDKFIEEFPKQNDLDILKIPKVFREQDDNLKFKPHYVFSNKDGYQIRIGPEVMSIISSKPYPGWSEYSKIIHNAIEKFKETGIPKSFLRVGYRVINFFNFEENLIEGNLFSKTKLALKHEDEDLQAPAFLQLITEKDGVQNNLQLATTTAYSNKKGASFDIDSSLEFDENNMDVDEVIEKCHESLNYSFFSNLTTEFINELGASYGDN